MRAGTRCTSIEPPSSQYLMALSTSRHVSCSIDASLPRSFTPSASDVSKFLPFCCAMPLNESTALPTTAATSTSDSCCSALSRSSPRTMVMRSRTSPSRRSTWLSVDCVHSVSPESISVSSVFARMTAIGVFNSWLAFVMNFCCLLAFSISDLMALFENANTAMNATTSASTVRMSVFVVTLLTFSNWNEQSRKTTIEPFSVGPSLYM